MANLSFSRARNASDNGGDDSWKAQAFVNIWMPTADGGRRKVGALPLKDSRAWDAAAIQRLQSGGEEALRAFVNAIEFDFQMAVSDKEVSAGF